MEPLLQKNNSVIFQNPHEYFGDISEMFTMKSLMVRKPFEQANHQFIVGDILYYDAKDGKFILALAHNTKESEVVGIVADIIDEHHFTLSTTGIILTDRYNYPPGTQLYLSNINEGKAVSIPPYSVVKPVGETVEGGISVEIDMGWLLHPEELEDESYERYTQEELDEIINNIW